ncbi:MAG: M23 family metallopeptidase [Deltaproteobacteria bacterium]|nr:M23 family metallopeptidase [Deltaproteobacteria bacterium]
MIVVKRLVVIAGVCLVGGCGSVDLQEQADESAGKGESWQSAISGVINCAAGETVEYGFFTGKSGQRGTQRIKVKGMTPRRKADYRLGVSADGQSLGGVAGHDKASFEIAPAVFTVTVACTRDYGMQSYEFSVNLPSHGGSVAEALSWPIACPDRLGAEQSSGQDLEGRSKDKGVYAAAPGTVIAVERFSGAGKTVVIEHPEAVARIVAGYGHRQLRTQYSGLSGYRVRVGDRIYPGERIGTLKSNRKLDFRLNDTSSAYVRALLPLHYLAPLPACSER